MRKWRFSGKQASALVGAMILISQTFSSGPEKPTLILVAGGLLIGTPLVKLVEERAKDEDK